MGLTITLIVIGLCLAAIVYSFVKIVSVIQGRRRTEQIRNEFIESEKNL